MSDVLSKKVADLLIRIAESHAKDHGMDGNSYGFVTEDWPVGAGGFGDSKEEAAVEFLSQIYPEVQ